MRICFWMFMPRKLRGVNSYSFDVGVLKSLRKLQKAWIHGQVKDKSLKSLFSVFNYLQKIMVDIGLIQHGTIWTKCNSTCRMLFIMNPLIVESSQSCVMNSEISMLCLHALSVIRNAVILLLFLFGKVSFYYNNQNCVDWALDHAMLYSFCFLTIWTSFWAGSSSFLLLWASTKSICRPKVFVRRPLMSILARTGQIKLSSSTKFTLDSSPVGENKQAQEELPHRYKVDKGLSSVLNPAQLVLVEFWPCNTLRWKMFKITDVKNACVPFISLLKPIIFPQGNF